MGRAVVTAAEVEAARGRGELRVPEGAVITALAKDRAQELGIQILAGTPAAAPASSQEDDLTSRVGKILAQLLATGGPGGNTGPAQARGVKLVRIADSETAPFPYPGPGPDQKVAAVDVVGPEDGSPMAAGYMTLTEGSFPWEFTYDEVQVVLEGELHLTTSDGVKVGRPGDVFYVPKGSRIRFGTPSWAKFVYVTFPAEWAGGAQ